MDSITAFIEKLNFYELVPDLSGLAQFTRTLASVCMLIGPACMLVLGLLYYFKPPREANWKFGFRTYFGMGSVEAWRFTQKVAGLAYGILGLVLLIVMGVLCAMYSEKDGMSMMSVAGISLIAQFVLLMITHIGVGVTSAVFFDGDGNRKR